jgi:hypothetical protein
MRTKKFTESKVVHAATGVAIVMVIYFFALIAGISRLEAQTKSEGQQSLNKIIQSLKALDTAYASGNTAEAQSDSIARIASGNRCHQRFPPERVAKWSSFLNQSRQS